MGRSRGAKRLGQLADRLRPASRRALHAELEETRRRLGRARARARRQQARLEAVQSELRRTRDSVRDPFPGVELPEAVARVVDQVLDEGLTFLRRPNLEMLAKLVRHNEESGLPGLIVEAGTARGGSAIVLGAAKSQERAMKVYDVFGMIPPPSDRDGTDVHARYDRIKRGEAIGTGGQKYYGYREDLYEEVRGSFARLGVPTREHNVDLVRGLFEDTIELDEPVALAHLDGDWYESTMTCLSRIAPLLVRGGRLVLDDYYAWSGCRAAVDEYFADRPGYLLERRSKLHVVRL